MYCTIKKHNKKYLKVQYSNKYKLYEIKRKLKRSNKANYPKNNEFALKFKKLTNLNENGMWLLFDAQINEKFVLHFLTLNIIHIFNDERKKNYIYPSNMYNYSQADTSKFKWIKTYEYLKIYKNNYINNLNNLVKNNNPITYLQITSLFENNFNTIFEICKPFIAKGCILYFFNFTSFNNIEKLLTNNKFKIKILIKKDNKLLLRILYNPFISTKTKQITKKYKNSVKVINTRFAGALWHYYHFLIDCLHKEYNIAEKNIIRLDLPYQTIGTFDNIYKTIAKKKNIEYGEKKFENIYCKTKLIKSLNTNGPFSINFFNEFCNYCIKHFFNKNYNKYEIILIERGTQKLKYNKENLNKYISQNISLKNVKTGSERRSINNHNKLDIYLQNKFKNKYSNIILENTSIANQITLFNNAKIIIAQHGAALANLIFCKTNTKILEIEPINLPCFKNIAYSKQLKYYSCKNEIQDIVNKLNMII